MHSRRFQRVTAIPLQSLLESHFYFYFSFDIEGAELQVLRSVNWNQVHKPRLITIEHNSNQHVKSDLLSLFTDLGYTAVHTQHEWLVRGDLWLKLNY